MTVLGAGALVSIGNQGDLLAALLLHLRAGGAYVVDKSVDHSRRTPGHLDEILAAAEDRAEGRALSRDERAVVAYIRNVWNTEEVVVVTKRGRHALKLREDQVTDLLPVREPAIAVSVLEVRPSGRLDLGMDDTSYGPSRADPWPTHLAYPEMTLRHYEGPVISVGGMRLRAGMTILPESFRWPHAKNLLNPRLRLGDGAVRATGPTGTCARARRRPLLRRLAVQRSLRSPHHRGAESTMGMGPRPTRDPGAEGLLPHQPGSREGRLARASTVHRVRRPRVAPGVLGPAGAVAQRRRSVADVAQQAAVLRASGHQGDVVQADQRAPCRWRARPP